MESFFTQILNVPVPENQTEIPPEIKEKIKNFKAFIKEVSAGKEGASGAEKDKLDAMLSSDDLDVEASRLLFVLSTKIMPMLGRDRLESLLRKYYGYDECHSERVLKYLQFLELAYSGSINWNA